VQFYRQVAEAVPELGIVVYDNPGAFKRPITSWDRLAAIENVVGAKYISLGPGYWEALRQVRRADGELTLVQMDAYLPAALTWDTDVPLACWSSSVSCGPAPTSALMDAIGERRWEHVFELSQRMAHTFETFFPDGDMQVFGRHTAAIAKARMNAAGFLRAGPVRPPDPATPERYLEGGRESGRRWKELVESIRNQ
jgi:dihydrodipicolinate synthase/N-acetylneuraminate lyase